MPLFYFHFRDEIVHNDDVGVELADVDSAKEQAVNLLGEMLRQRPGLLTSDADWCIELTDERGLVLHVVTVILQSTVLRSN